jgi:AcrR family transcriptional regulator
MARMRGQHHGDLRRVLEDAALELVDERGPRGFTLIEASRRAGVSAAAPYNHFADRDALLIALTMRGFEEQRRRFALAVSGTVDAVAQLAAFAAAYVDYAADHRGLFRLTASADDLKARSAELRSAGEAVLDVLERPCRALCATDDEAVALVFAVGAVSSGYAALLTDGALHSVTDPRAFARDGAAHAVRTLAHAAPSVGQFSR